MNFELVFTLADLGKIALWAAGLIALIYVILILKRAYVSMKAIHAIIEENRENIDQVLDTAPGITKNIEDITSSAVTGLDYAKMGAEKLLNKKSKKKDDEE